jgi:dTDP-4-amino-4,6-dideoxygalactose transaminase
VFGNACEVEKIDAIAKKNNLKVIYDAAHAFNVKYKGESILNYGDISTLSFHATKTFHSIEGGALIINDDSLVEKARYLINFGIKNREEIPDLGTNAKMNEFEAAMGLCVLDDMQELNIKRKIVYEFYKKELEGVVKFQQQNIDSTQNYSYFPIILESEEQLKKIEKALNLKDIFPRRYFYPSLDTLDYIDPTQCCEISRDIASRVLCLPMYVELQVNQQKNIIETLINNI